MAKKKTTKKKSKPTKAKKGKTRGRKNIYDDVIKPRLELIESWCMDGDIEETIFKRLGIGKTAFYRYKSNHEDLRNALKRGKELVDVQVKNSLLKRAMGYKYKETTVDHNGTKVVTKLMAPDVTAQIFWMKNRVPEDWRDQRHIQNTGTMVVENRPLTKSEKEELLQDIKESTDNE